jgi:L-iditol 2-dehydrogenase
MKVKEIDAPSISMNEVLVRIRSVGVCPTDLKIYRHGSKIVKPPVILGHEFSGEVVESKVATISPGDRVNVAPDGPCMSCTECSRGLENLCRSLLSIGINVDGAYAELLRVPSRFISDGLIFKLPDDVSFELGALIEPVAAGIHSLNLVNPQHRDSAMIVGDGPNALIHLQLLKDFFGVKRVTVIGLLEHRLAKAKNLGADEVVHAENLASCMEKLKQTGVDIVDLAIGNPDALKEAASLMTAGSRVVIFAGAVDDVSLPITMNQVHYNQFSITGSSGTTIAEYKKAVELVGSSVVNLVDLISHTFPLNEIMTAFECAEKSKGLKVIVNP